MPIEIPTEARNSPSARLVGELRSAITNASAIPIASSAVMIWGVVSITSGRQGTRIRQFARQIEALARRAIPSRVKAADRAVAFFGDPLRRRVDDALARMHEKDLADHHLALGS